MAKMGMIVETISTSLNTFDRSYYTIDAVNDAYLTTIAKNRDEGIGAPCYGIIHGLDAPCATNCATASSFRCCCTPAPGGGRSIRLR